LTHDRDFCERIKNLSIAEVEEAALLFDKKQLKEKKRHFISLRALESPTVGAYVKRRCEGFSEPK
jgi:hypothetical protein